MAFLASSNSGGYPHKLRRLYWPFLGLAEACRDIVGTVTGSFTVDGKRYTIPRFAFRGPAAACEPVRIGLFALLEGDEPAGALAFERVLAFLTQAPIFAAGLELAFYPLCNPTGFEDGSAANRAGCSLGREFWRESRQPELRILEAELARERYDGLIVVGRAAGLTAPPDQHPRPFEFLLEPRQGASMTQQAETVGCAVRELIAEFREFIVPSCR